MAWQGESVRFVLQGPFPQSDPYSLFQELSGTVPQAMGPTPGQPGSTATGSFKNYQLQLQVRPSRVDVVLAIQPTDDDFGLIPDPTDALTNLVPLSQSIADRFAAFRLSFVTTLTNIADGPDGAADIFYENTHIPRIDAAPLDLIFSYNCPGTTKGGLVFNRLQKWQTVNVQIAAFVIGQNVAPIKQSEYFGVSLMLDVNIPAQQSPIETSVAKAIIEELAQETKMLISKAS